jgi:hypothetical protein
VLKVTDNEQLIFRVKVRVSAETVESITVERQRQFNSMEM